MNSGGGGGVTLKSRVTQIIKLKLAVLGALNKGAAADVKRPDASNSSGRNLTNPIDNPRWKSVRKSIGDISIASTVQAGYFNFHHIAQCCQMAKFDPFLSFDCARREGIGNQARRANHI